MPGWRLVELDSADGGRPTRTIDPAALAVLVVVALVALNVVPQLLPHSSAPPSELAPTPTPSPANAWEAFALDLQPREALACGSFDESTPAPTFSGAALALRRVDAELAIAADPDWAWCIAGVRAYADGIELVGALAVRGRQRTGALRPALRDATFSGELAGFGSIGPGELLEANGYSVVRLRAVVDASARDAFRNAVGAATRVRLRVEAMAGPWSFPSLALREGPLDAEASAYGVSFRLHDLKLLSDSVATTLYARSDFPDPAIASFEWDAIDDLGTTYRALPDRRVDGTLPGFYRTFAPRPPGAATQIAFSIRRIHLVALDQFSVDLPFH